MRVVLVVDDEPGVVDIVCAAVRQAGHRPEAAVNGHQAIKVAARVRPDLALLDHRLPDTDGLTVFRRLRQETPGLIGLMLTGYGSVPHAVESLHAGMADYLEKPFRADAVIDRLQALLGDGEAESTGADGFDGMIGQSAAMQQVFARIVRVAPSDSPVLILGETGTGKELVARSVHKRSRRSRGPFVDVNCPAVPTSLFEAELFGHERGAFTDAREQRSGCFEQAAHGTLFLDEVGDLALDAQAKLLRALDTKEIRRLGGRSSLPIDVRIVAATNVPLDEAVLRGAFRADLFWRLNALSIQLPPLRERREDVLPIVTRLLPQLAHELRLPHDGISDAAMSVLCGHNWPGNIRELTHYLRQALVAAAGGRIGEDHLPARLRRQSDLGITELVRPSDRNLPDALAAVSAMLERRWIEEALRSHPTLTAAARALGIDVKTLYERRSRHGLG